MIKHMRRKRRKLVAGILGVCMLLGCTASGLPVYAADEAGAAAGMGSANAGQGVQNPNPPINGSTASAGSGSAGQAGDNAAAGQAGNDAASGQPQNNGAAGQAGNNAASGQPQNNGAAGQAGNDAASGQPQNNGAAGANTEGNQAGSVPDKSSKNQTDNPGAADAGQPAGGAGQNQIGMKENSWRYHDGKATDSQRTMNRSRFSFRSAPYSNAWEKVDGVYMNSNGEPIEGAVQKGIDVSEHQGQIDWNKVKASGIDYAIIRCGYGDDVPGTGRDGQDDKCWEYNVSECERLGIPYGVYIYSYAMSVAQAESEAYHVIRLIKGHNLTFPVYFDMEDESTINVSADTKGQMAQKFADIITAAGYPVGIYANTNWFTHILTSPVFNNPSWSKWVAQYNPTCDYYKPYDMWQYSSTGRVDGINGNVDMNFLMDTYKGPGSGTKPGGGTTPGDDVWTGGTTLAVRRGNQYHIKYTLSDGPADVVINYGKADDKVLVGDWDGDGVDTLCVRRGNTYYFKNSLSSGEADKVVKYGRADDEVLVGDWDGDGVDSLCVRRGNTYYIKNSLADGEADKVVKYGRKDDIVMAGDWDGDGVDTLCVRRGNTYYIKNSLADGAADATISYGRASDDILVGDWNGDGVDTLCVRRGNQYFIKNTIQNGVADKVIHYGKKDDITYAGKWQ